MDKKELKEIGINVIASKFFDKFAYKGTWLSGGSTEVYPVTVNMVNNSIVIQLDCFKGLRGAKQSLDKLVREIGEELVLRHYISKSDGSCPDEAIICFN